MLAYLIRPSALAGLPAAGPESRSRLQALKVRFFLPRANLYLGAPLFARGHSGYYAPPAHRVLSSSQTSSIKLIKVWVGPPAAEGQGKHASSWPGGGCVLPAIVCPWLNYSCGGGGLPSERLARRAARYANRSETRARRAATATCMSSSTRKRWNEKLAPRNPSNICNASLNRSVSSIIVCRGGGRGWELGGRGVVTRHAVSMFNLRFYLNGQSGVPSRSR